MNADDLFPTPPPGCVSEYHLDKWRAGELDPACAQATRRHLDGCAACAAKLTEIEAARAAFVDRARPLPLPAGARPRPRRAAMLGGLGVAAAGLAALALFALPRDPGALTRTKGGHRVTYFVEGATGLRAGAPGEAVRPGERVQLVVGAEGAGGGEFVAVLGRDGRGQAVILHPEQGPAAPLPAGDRVQLPFSIQIDDAPGPEEIHVLLCAGPAPLEGVRAGLAGSAGALTPPAGCAAETLRLPKELR